MSDGSGAMVIGVAYRTGGIKYCGR